MKRWNPSISMSIKVALSTKKKMVNFTMKSHRREGNSPKKMLYTESSIMYHFQALISCYRLILTGKTEKTRTSSLHARADPLTQAQVAGSMQP